MSGDKLDLELDALLARVSPAEPPVGLADRILTAAPRAPRRGFGERLSALLFPHGRRWPAAGALASLGVGVMAGYAGAQDAAIPLEADSAVYAALGLDTARFDWEDEG